MLWNSALIMQVILSLGYEKISLHIIWDFQTYTHAYPRPSWRGSSHLLVNSNCYNKKLETFRT